jgi:Putative Ig domain/Lecithin:cholesterol acyltransferase/Domain of unknown function (DUF4114)
MTDIKLGNPISKTFNTASKTVQDATSTYYSEEYDLVSTGDFRQVSVDFRFTKPSKYYSDKFQILANNNIIYDTSTYIASPSLNTFNLTTFPGVTYKIRFLQNILEKSSDSLQYDLSLKDGGIAKSLSNDIFDVFTLNSEGTKFRVATTSSVKDVALSPDGKLYGIDGSSNIVLIDPASNKVTSLGTLKGTDNLPIQDIKSIEFAKDGKLYVVGAKANEETYAFQSPYADTEIVTKLHLYRVDDLQNTTVTQIGDLPLALNSTGVFTKSSNLYTIDIANNRLLTISGDTLWQVPLSNPSSASAIGDGIGIGSFLSPVKNITFENSQLIAYYTDISYSQHIKIDINSGKGTLDGNKLTDSNLFFTGTSTIPDSLLNTTPTVITNHAPTVVNPIADTTTPTNSLFNFTVPVTTFIDSDVGDKLTYKATLDNGNPLPAWLKFDANTRTFSGTPGTSDINNINVKVTATDLQKLEVSDTFSINIKAGNTPTINDLAGNTTATARNIGKLTTRQGFDDFIGYYNSTSQDGVDYYKFTIDQKSAVTLSVGGIAFTDGELRLELRNDKDEVIRFTDNTNDIRALLNPDSERTTGSLLPGTYFARVNSNNSSKGGAYNFSASAKPQIDNSATFRKPVFVIPGIGGSLWDISAPDNKQREEEWFSKRGLDPNKLVIDPLKESYSSLIASLKDAGYQEGKDLFIVPYDWRLAPAPTDGQSDGKVSGISAVSITDGTYEYGVDYLGHYLKQASESWSASHNGQTLDSVDIIAHSTGGLIARAYMQSNAYGGQYGQFSNLSLPLVDNLITLGVPNSGSPKAWNILNDDWNAGIEFSTVLKNLAYIPYKKLMSGKEIDGNRVTKQSIISVTGDSDFSSEKNKIEFIHQYIPTIQALLSTDNFGVVVSQELQNKLLLDLNAESGIRSIGFNGEVIEIYGDKNETIKSVQLKEDKTVELFDNGSGVIQSLTDPIKHPTRLGDKYYEKITTGKDLNSGDGTVLTNSAKLINKSGSLSVKDVAFGSVEHGDLPSNTDVINTILNGLSQPSIKVLSNPFDSAFNLLTGNSVMPIAESLNKILDQVKSGTSLLGSFKNSFFPGLIVTFDPVEGFIVDSQGRRLGYSKSTGALNEIPNSLWLGEAEQGIGFIKGQLDPYFKLQLSGLGENHEIRLFGVQDGKLITAESSGFLTNGQTKQVPLTFTQIPVAQPFTLQKATDNVWNVSGSGKVKISLLGKSTTQLNEIGIFKLDATRKINGIAPGAAGFAKAAIESGSVVFTALPDRTTDGLTLSRSIQVNNGERLGFFLIANGSVEEDLKTNNFSNVTTSADLVNPYTTSPDQVPLQVKENQGLYTLDWKQGDKNLSFNFQVDPAPDTSLTSISNQQGKKEGEVLDLRAFTGQNIQATFTLKREAGYNDSVSFYKIDDVAGTIISSSGQKFKPGDSGYVQAALKNAIAGLNLAGKNGQTVTVDKVLQGGSLYAPILMSNVTASRPTGENAFTAFSLGNADRTDHVRLLGGNTFGFEDLIGGGDKDFNDVIVQASFKTV